LKDIGFTNVSIDRQLDSKGFVKDWLPGSRAEEFVLAAYITAFRPAAKL
jgi:hypothetical protein